MTDTTQAQAAPPEPQAGDGTQTEQEQPNTEQLTPEQLRAQVTAANQEAAATRKKLRTLETQLADAEKAKAAEAEKLAAEQGKFQELYEAEKRRAAETEARLHRMEHDQQRRDAAQAAGIPQLWQRLQGETAEELTADAVALAAMMQPAGPANGQPARTAATPPTPAPQGANGMTAEERRQKARSTF